MKLKYDTVVLSAFSTNGGHFDGTKCPVCGKHLSVVRYFLSIAPVEILPVNNNRIEFPDAPPSLGVIPQNISYALPLKTSRCFR